MDVINQALDKFDEYAEHIPQLVQLCSKNQIRPGYVLGGVTTLVVLVGAFFQGYNLVSALLTCIYPIIASIKALESRDEDDDKKWLSFWTVFGIFQTVEMLFSWVLTLIPFYYTLRLAFFVYLMAPQTNGAYMLYESVFSPLVRKNEKKINKIIDGVSKEAKKVVSQVASAENIEKATKIVEGAKEAEENSLNKDADKKEE